MKETRIKKNNKTFSRCVCVSTTLIIEGEVLAKPTQPPTPKLNGSKRPQQWPQIEVALFCANLSNRRAFFSGDD